MDIGGNCGLVGVMVMMVMMVTAVARIKAFISINQFNCVFCGGICGI